MYSHHIKPGSTLQNGYPFVCQSLPFVCSNNPAILPLVGYKLPLVCNKGFTLIELIIALTVAGILMALAAPNMWQFFGKNRLAANTNDLLADINLSRSEAIKRSTRAGICATAVNGAACAAGGNWLNGWLVYYIDPTTSASITIRTHEQLTGKSTLTSATDKIEYSKDGTVNTGTGNYDLCDTTLKRYRRINISTTGRPTLTTPSPDSC